MFDLVHKYKKFITVIIGMVALTFVFWGVENRVTRGSRETVATVNGMEISVREFGDELRRQQDSSSAATSTPRRSTRPNRAARCWSS
jgi:hypothetical protein